jgi:SAM-dependent methyltransferase
VQQELLYDYPQYYEIAFSFRNIEAEAAFLNTCIQRHSLIDVKRVLEIACGPAPHAGELVERGFTYIGLDINPVMLKYAATKWRNAPRPIELVEADMVSFSLDQPVDFAFVMLGSLYLNSLADMSRHFDSIASVLRPGGLYFLDWCIQFNDPMIPKIRSSFEAEIDGVCVDSRFDTRLVDPAQQLYEETWTVHVDDHGRRKQFQMVERNRAVFPQEFLLFLQSRSDFEFVGWWHDWDLRKPIDEAREITRPVVLIRRK